MLESSRDKNEDTYRRGEKSLFIDPGSELNLGRKRGKKSARIILVDGVRKK